MLIDLIGGIKWERKIDNVFGQVKQSKKNKKQKIWWEWLAWETEKDGGTEYLQLFQEVILQKEEK